MAIDFPSSPTEGQIFNASPGRSFVSRSGVWVPAPLKTALPKNYIVNPYMQVSQQNGSTSYAQGSNGVAGISTIFYPADQWVTQWSWNPLQGSFAGTMSTVNYPISNQIQIIFSPYSP